MVGDNEHRRPSLRALTFSVLLGTVGALGLGGLAGCKSYLLQQGEVYRQVEVGAYSAAEARLAKLDKAEKRNNRVLYSLDRGLVAFYAGDYDIAIKYLDIADKEAETLFRDVGNEALALAVNPNVTPYYADPVERLMMNYFKALAFWHQGKMSSALVEVRRMDIFLKGMEQRYIGRDKAYKQDAFIPLFMGLVYEASGEWNNAFIAYRNSHKIYTDYAKEALGLSMPESLKRDLIRAAFRAGFSTEAQRYATDFGFSQNEVATIRGTEKSVAVLSHLGLAPLRTQWALNFVVSKPKGLNIVRLSNSDLNFLLDLPVDEKDTLWNGVSFVRITMPRYAYRAPMYQALNQAGKPLTPSQDIASIKQRILKDEIWKTLGKELGRVALKKATELALRKKGETTAASVLSVANAITQQADLRSCAILPAQITYERVALSDTSSGIKLRYELNGAAQFSNKSSQTVWIPLARRGNGLGLVMHHLLQSTQPAPFPPDSQFWQSIR
jgi:uncharacterized protein